MQVRSKPRLAVRKHVAIALRRAELSGELEFFYWKGAGSEEIDFVVKRGRRVTQLVQACWDTADLKTRGREVRALLKAGAELKCRDLVLLSEAAERREEASWYGLKGRIQCLPFRRGLWEIRIS